MPAPRILTFNFHEPYLCLMAKTGLAMDAAHYDAGPLKREWHTLFRPVPAGLTLINEATWRERIASNYYDVIIAQNEMNAIDVAKARCGKLLLCHNRRTYLNTTASADDGADPIATYGRLLSYLREEFGFIYISESKRADYGIPGRVILPGIDLDEYGGYRGEKPAVIRVGNTMRQRTLMFDFDFQEKVCAGIPNEIFGVNSDIPNAQVASSWGALREIYRAYRCMLHVTREEYEDGYNLAMLEAMATGMPVVSLANATSPLTDGIDGYVSHDAEVLRTRLRELLDDPAHAKALGARGRETVAEKFPLARFQEQWRSAILGAAEQSTRAQWRAEKRAHPEGAPHLLLHYVASPTTTGRYVEEAARDLCHVTTCGFRVPEEVLQIWGFEGPPPAYGPQDVPLPHRAPYADLVRALPGGALPDLYLWIDSGPAQIEPDIAVLPLPKVAYLIDTHVSPELRLAMARHFDIVFLAQKAQVEAFKARGIAQARWLPLACSPRLHGLPAMDRHFDFSYVGSLSPEESGRRRTLLNDLAACFPNSYIGRAWPEDMARIYAQSKIVVNACHNNDVNMRVFEALAAGALLITDNAEGLEDLFVPGEHLIVYHDDAELPALVARYLKDDAARERIARAGQERVLRDHTYQKRMESLLAACEETLGAHRRGQDPAEKSNKAYYQCPRREVAAFVPLHTRRLLDVGCGQGALGRLLKEERGLEEVAGIEIIESAWTEARKVLDTCLLGSIEDMELPFPDDHFDCIICADVLEHLVEPPGALRKLARVLAPDGSIVISIPNIRYHETVAMLASGAWSYAEAGIMDSTHLRFFCKPDLAQMVEDAGLRVAVLQPLSIFDADRLKPGDDGTLKVGPVTYLHPTEEDIEGLRVYQYGIIACKPGNDRLGHARAALDAGQFDAAIALTADATGADPFEQRMLLAKAYARSGRLAEAEQAYLVMMQEHDGPALFADFGVLLLAMGRTAEARELLERALPRIESADRVEAALGLADLAEGKLNSAFERMRNALAAGATHVALWPHAIPLGRELGRMPELLPALIEHADFYPGNAEVGVALGELLIAEGRIKEARERLEMLLLLDPANSQAQALLARCIEA